MRRRAAPRSPHLPGWVLLAYLGAYVTVVGLLYAIILGTSYQHLQAQQEELFEAVIAEISEVESSRVKASGAGAGRPAAPPTRARSGGMEWRCRCPGRTAPWPPHTCTRRISSSWGCVTSRGNFIIESSSPEV